MSINLLTHEWAQTKNLKSQYYPEITSTNDVAKAEFSQSQQDFCLYLADHQTKGRGRGDQSWQNLGDGEILLSTWCFKTDKPPQPLLTPLLGLALYESLFVFDSSLPLRLKAPNDMYLGEGKLSGLLVEVDQQGPVASVYIGLGLNAFGAPKIDTPTASLADHTQNVRQLWADFCKYLYNQFLIAIEKGALKELSEDDRDDLLEALNSGLPEDQQYTDVSPQCDLHGPSGVTSWMNL